MNLSPATLDRDYSKDLAQFRFTGVSYQLIREEEEMALLHMGEAVDGIFKALSHVFSGKATIERQGGIISITPLLPDEADALAMVISNWLRG